MKENWQVSEFGPPESPGLYAVYVMDVYSKKSKPLYIGQSSNIKNRVLSPSHPYRILLDKYNWPLVVYTKWKIERSLDKRKSIEKYLIEKFNPTYNTQYNVKPIHRYGIMERGLVL